MNFNQFLKKHNLQNKSTSNVKISEVVNKLKLKDFNIYLRDDKLTTKQGIINLGHKKGTHWVCFCDHNYFDSFGVKPPKSIERQLKQFHRGGFATTSPRPLSFSTYKIQEKQEKLCASYCLYILYLINSGLTFEKAVIKLFLFLIK